MTILKQTRHLQTASTKCYFHPESTGYQKAKEGGLTRQSKLFIIEVSASGRVNLTAISVSGN